VSGEVKLMAYTVLIHMVGEEPILAEMEELPNPNDVFVTCTGARRRDGKPLPYALSETEVFLFPWHRINLIEVLPSEVEKEEIVEFYRD